MTCHASKGKEADFVIILCVDEGQFPAKKKQLHIDGGALTESSDAPARKSDVCFTWQVDRCGEREGLDYA